jgi:Family of unknown function (DUF5329)
MRLFITAAALSLIWSFMAFSFPSPGLSAQLSPVQKGEIEHLLSYIEQSGCQFCRNGTWYDDTKKVRHHVELKYDYFMKKKQINSTEDFITWSASKSEMSGKPYLVKSGNQSPMLLSQWLLDELERYRKKE